MKQNLIMIIPAIAVIAGIMAEAWRHKKSYRKFPATEILAQIVLLCLPSLLYIIISFILCLDNSVYQIFWWINAVWIWLALTLGTHTANIQDYQDGHFRKGALFYNAVYASKKVSALLLVPQALAFVAIAIMLYVQWGHLEIGRVFFSLSIGLFILITYLVWRWPTIITKN